MIARLLLPGLAALVLCVPVVRAQEDVECTRLRIAGLPCPPSSSSAGQGATRPPLRPLAVPPRPAATVPHAGAAAPPPPGTSARDLSGAPVLPVPLAVPGLASALPGGTSLPRPALLPLDVTAPVPTNSPPQDTREPGQVVAYWANADEADSALSRLAVDARIASVRRDRLDYLGGVLAVFQLRTQAEALTFREELRRDYPGLTADLNTHYRPLQKAQPRIYLPGKIDLPAAGGRPLLARGVRIGMVDSVVAPLAALADTRILRKSFVADTDTPAPPSHGTAVATLMVGRDAVAGFAGVAPGASLYSAEIMRSAGSDELTSSAALVRALDWLLAEKVQVINLSLGGPGDAVMARAFTRLAGFAVVVVAAAGNGGPSAAPAYPAAYPGVIAVTATDASDRSYAAANRGSYITLAAPGVDVWVPDAGSGRYVSGTSFSAAVVSAGVALLLAQHPQPDAAAVARRLCRDARDLGAAGPDPVFGCGLLQVSAALREDRP